MRMHSRVLRVALPLAAAITLLAHPGVRPAWADEIDDDAAAALRALYDGTPSARVLGQKAAAILVFPNIVKAGFLVFDQKGLMAGMGIQGSKITRTNR